MPGAYASPPGQVCSRWPDEAARRARRPGGCRGPGPKRDGDGLDAAPDAIIHVVPHPLPEAVLAGEVRVGLHLGPPALHDVVLHGPEAHAVALDQLAPVVTDLRARVDQAHGDVLREVVEWAQIDLL